MAEHLQAMAERTRFHAAQGRHGILSLAMS